jgi:flavodoxin
MSPSPSDTQARWISRRSALFAPLLPLASAAAAQACAQTPGASRTLVAYLTRSGNTRVIAEALGRQYHADVFRIRTAAPYPADYEAHVEQANRERQAGVSPPLAETVSDIAAYDSIFLGFPVWGGALPSPVRSFLGAHNLSGRTIAPFVTHGGYGPGSVIATLKELAPQASFTTPFVLQCDQERATLERVSAWLGSIAAEL